MERERVATHSDELQGLSYGPKRNTTLSFVSDKASGVTLAVLSAYCTFSVNQTADANSAVDDGDCRKQSETTPFDFVGRAHCHDMPQT